MKELISVIIPVYNAEKYLEKCLKNVINQTYKNIEIILINDGSIDNSGIICDEYKNKDNRIKVFHTKNNGVSAARNLGIENSKGDYIIFIDADDYIELNAFEEILTKNNNYDFITFSYYKLMKDDKICYDNRNKIEILKKEEALIKIMDDRYFQGFACNKLFKRSIIIENKLYFDENIKINEDLLFCVNFLEKSSAIAYYSKPLYYYRQLTTSAIHSKDAKKYVTALLAYEKIEKIYIKNNIDKELFYINFFSLNLVLKELLIKGKDKTKIKEINDNLKKYRKVVFYSKEICIKKKLKLIIKYLFIRQYSLCKKIYYRKH